MALSTNPGFFNAPWSAQIQITAAMTTALQDLGAAVGGALARKVTGITLVSNDTAAKQVVLSLFKSGVSALPLITVPVPAGAGTDGVTPAVNVLGSTLLPGLPIDSDGDPYLVLQAGDKLQVNAVATLTTAKLVTVTAFGGEG